MSASRLLACPFCGGQDVRVHQDQPPSFVCCHECWTWGPEADKVEAAKLLWNTRARVGVGKRHESGRG